MSIAFLELRRSHAEMKLSTNCGTVVVCCAERASLPVKRPPNPNSPGGGVTALPYDVTEEGIHGPWRELLLERE